MARMNIDRGSGGVEPHPRSTEALDPLGQETPEELPLALRCPIRWTTEPGNVPSLMPSLLDTQDTKVHGILFGNEQTMYFRI
jgi:hypothetical protein